MRAFRSIAAALSLFLPGQGMSCDLALALAVDVSASIDTAEYRLQMDGLAAALRDPIVSEALVQAQASLLLVQWSGKGSQMIAVPWSEIGDFAQVEAFANQVADAPRAWRTHATAIGEALSFTLDLFPKERRCQRRLIDLSGDGTSNEGAAPTSAHPALKSSGVTVNALAIEDNAPELTSYFFENVLVGEGAFVVTANDFADYPDKIRKKLLREVTKQTSSAAFETGKSWPVDNSALRRKGLSRK